MATEKTKIKATPLQWVIRILIIAIFAVALAIAAVRLMEWNRDRQRLEELERQKQELEEQLGEQQAQDGTTPPID